MTGATSGIGRAIARALGKAGAKTVITGMGDEAAAEVVAGIEADGGEAKYVAGELADRDGWKALLSKATAPYGHFTVFVHCASPARKENQTAMMVSEEEWDAMLNTNLRSGFFLAQAIARGMRVRRPRGRILFMTPLHAETPRNLPHYSASKAGQAMVVRELARALGHNGIRVNGIAPGAIPGGGWVAEDDGALEAMIPMGRTGTPEDVAQVAMTLLSDAHSGYVTGAIVPVDGGLQHFNWLKRPDAPR
ncbi:MAG: SDR family oxidoreductase [Rhodospirillaceae bacterium]